MNEASFVEWVAAGLRDRGFEVVRDFAIPGTNARVDLFLPQLPRALIEIKLGKVATTYHARSILRAGAEASSEKVLLCLVGALPLNADGSRANEMDRDTRVPGIAVDPTSARFPVEANRIADIIASALNKQRATSYKLPPKSKPLRAAVKVAQRGITAGQH